MSGSEFPGASENISKSSLGTPFSMMTQEICKAVSCDTLVRFWSEKKNEISVRFLKTLFFGHVKGHDVERKLWTCLKKQASSYLFQA